MTTRPRRIHIEPGTEIGKLLDEVGSGPMLLEKDGVIYSASEAKDEEIWSGYDPLAVKEALRQSAGAFAGMDTEQWKRDVRAGREQDSRGRPA